MCQHLELACQIAGGLRPCERLDQVGERAVVDAASALHCGDRQTDHDVKVAEIVQEQFPGSDTKRNFKWVEDGTTYEADLTACIDSVALGIECKSGKITPSALRDASGRWRRHTQELLIDPNVQSLRLKSRFGLLGSNPTAADPMRDEIGCDLGEVRKVVRLSVCLEDFGSIQARRKQVEDTGWLPADFAPCPTRNLADCGTVCDILEHPVRYLANELELLGLSLRLGSGEVEPDVQISMVDIAGALDAYCNSLNAGVTLDKPRPAVAPLCASVLLFSGLRRVRPDSSGAPSVQRPAHRPCRAPTPTLGH